MAHYTVYLMLRLMQTSTSNLQTIQQHQQLEQPQLQRFDRVAPNEHVLAIESLVAELELNTDTTSCSEKRRSFPTTNTEIYCGSSATNKRNNPQQTTNNIINQQQQHPQPSSQQQQRLI